MKRPVLGKRVMRGLYFAVDNLIDDTSQMHKDGQRETALDIEAAHDFLTKYGAWVREKKKEVKS